MFGYYRFILSASVAMFHFGYGRAGPNAVYAFYIVSGFLLTRAFEQTYALERRSMGRFVANRALRILPLYWMTLAVTLVVNYCCHADARFFDNDLKYYFDELTLGYGRASFPNVIHSTFPRMIPQAWSLTSELQFYLTVPLLARLRSLTHQARWMPIVLLAVSAIYPLLAVLGGLNTGEQHVTKSFVGSYFVFVLGACIHWNTDLLSIRRPLPLIRMFWAGLVVWAFAFIVLPRVEQAEPRFFYAFLPMHILLVWLASRIRLQSTLAKRVDDLLGKLSYGVFLNHFVAGTLVTTIYARAGVIPNPGTLIFSIALLTMSSLIAWVTYAGVERPLENMRQRVRGRAVASSGVEA